MEVVLLERIEKLGIMGDVVTVKDGFARNFLLPQKKALRATQDNIAQFEAQRAQLEARNLELRKEAEAVAEKIEGTKIIIVRQASENDQLYGSVSVRDIAEGLTEVGFSVDKSQIALDAPIKTIGIYPVRVVLHPEVSVDVSVNVARSQEEADAAETASEEALLAEAEAVFESEELAQQAVETLSETEEDSAEGETLDAAEEPEAGAEPATEDEASDTENDPGKS
ncbi:MAG: 50S ribosomal protein L9 [Alphaproteobacteria bacterium]